MQIEKRDAQQPIEKKILIFVLAVMKNFKCAIKSRDFTELSFSPRSQIAKEVMFSMTRAVDLIGFVLWIFAQYQFDRAIWRFVRGCWRAAWGCRFFGRNCRVWRCRFLWIDVCKIRRALRAGIPVRRRIQFLQRFS